MNAGGPLPPGFIERIARCLEEEETDIYTLSLYSMNTDDMNFFMPEDREKVLRIFKILKDDTRRHAELLQLIVELGSAR
ncbi:MAG TPA: hypothetical protein VL404_09955 [Candidatus Eisenbacteria bacterium]|nr:hypothetical protein [Candidatus Eisenbacteria bacterium]